MVWLEATKRDVVDDSQRIFWKRITSKTGVPIEAIAFIFDALTLARKYIAEELGQPEDRRRRCSAPELCHSFVRLAEDTFGAEYIYALNSWGLETSEKLGQVIYELVRWGLVRRQYPDEQSDFDGQFRFSTVSPGQNGRTEFHYPTDRLPKVIDPYRFSLRMALLVITVVAVLLGVLVRSK